MKQKGSGSLSDKARLVFPREEGIKSKGEDPQGPIGSFFFGSLLLFFYIIHGNCNSNLNVSSMEKFLVI